MMQEWLADRGRWKLDRCLDLNERMLLAVRAHTVPGSPAGMALRYAVEAHEPYGDEDLQRATCSSCNNENGRSRAYPCEQTRIMADRLGVPPVPLT